MLPEPYQSAIEWMNSVNTAIWRQQFLRRLHTLHLDRSVYSVLSQATHTEMSRFCGADGRPLTWEQWTAAVRGGEWKVTGLGPKRRRRLAAALAIQAADQP